MRISMKNSTNGIINKNEYRLFMIVLMREKHPKSGTTTSVRTEISSIATLNQLSSG